MKDGALLANAGHYDHEFDLAALREMAVESREVRAQRDRVRARRRAAAARPRARAGSSTSRPADGHPVEIMDLTFAVQALAAHHLAKPRG